MPDTQVVITGMGAVTPVGLDHPSTWDALVAGTSGLGPITAFDPEPYGIAARAAGEVTGFDGEALLGRRRARRTDRVIQFALVTAREALADAGLLSGDGDGDNATLDASLVDPHRVAVYLASGIGGLTSLLEESDVLRERGARRVSPFLLPRMLIDSVPGAVAIEFGLKGPNMSHVSACASGANAIGEAYELLRRSGADVVLAGGAESGILPLPVAGFENMGALTKWAGDPKLASRPFDKNRDGFAIGEGAAVLVLERKEHADARGAKAYATIAGYGTAADAVHATAPAEDGDGIIRAMSAALSGAGCTADDIDYVNAHGTSTRINDAVETVALKVLLGERAYDVPISSNKSMVGHLLGAGGAVEAMATARTIQTGDIPPTINLHEPDPACDLDYVPHVSRHADSGVSVAISNSLGFGGHNVALVLTRV